MPEKERQYLSESRSGKRQKKSDSSFSFIAILFYIMGILVFIGGTLQGIKILREARLMSDFGPFIRYIGMAYIGGGIITSIIFIGFGRNIALLQKINDKLNRL
ncbi:MAG: hypothetical protein ACOC4G_07945 [Bacillota bacterium]